MLTEEGRLPKHLHNLINEIKQDRTLREIAKNCFPRVEHLLMMSWLKARNVPIAVATNSIRTTAETMLRSAGIYDFLEVVVTNEDVIRSKPDPEIYLKTCEGLGLSPNQVLVIEDHEYGLQAAVAAGCHVLQVQSPAEVSTKLVEGFFTIQSSKEL
jgi:HAD superfamily hydrolase (TIGR01509 family)